MFIRLEAREENPPGVNLVLCVTGSVRILDGV